MAHFALLWKARTIEKHRQNFENEKINSIIMSNAEIPDKTVLQRWRHYRHGVQKRLSRTFSKWLPEGSTMSNFLVNFRAEIRFPHILLRSLFGFVGGLVLTYLCFVFLVFQLSLSLMHATVISSVFGMMITIGLTFSNRIRCLVFLLIPQLFSRAGRYTLTCYALVLILTGPATNSLKNSEVLSESMACSQEQIKTSVREINESSKKPYNSIKNSIKLIVEEMKRITIQLRGAMLKINRLILSIASLIQSSFSWLGSVAQSCNKQLGTPYKHCINSLKTGTENCKDCCAQVPWYCAAASIAKAACDILKPYDKFCIAADFAGETFYATVKKRLKNFTKRLSRILYLKIRTHHSYTFIGNTSSPGQVAAGIVTEIRKRADPILTWLSWSSCVTSLFLVLIIFRAKYYQHMYETRSRFDNRYITKEFRELDLKRLREGRETVLPLSKRERAKYVTTTSFRLVATEKVYLNRSAVFMTITTFKLLIHIVADYSLYWVLTTIQYHGALQSPLEVGLPTTGVHVTGKGFVSRLLQSLISTLDIPLMPSLVTPNSCLPKPYPPDFKRYSQIVTLIILLWFFALFEPYGLRLRHLIMGHYKPERAKTRSMWLYNHILRTRGNFLKFARRKLHREYKYSSERKLTFRLWIRYLIPFHWLRYLLGIQIEDTRCLLCSTMKDSYDENSELIRCEVPNCPGTYCTSCFSDIGQMCTVCLSPADYGDVSDVSLEKGSSDEDDDSDGSIKKSKEENTHQDFSSEDGENNPAKYDLENNSEYSDDIDNETNLLLDYRRKENTNEKSYVNKSSSVLGETYEKDIGKFNRDIEIWKNIFMILQFLSRQQKALKFYSSYKFSVHKYLKVNKKENAPRFARVLKKNKIIEKKTRKKKMYYSYKNCNNGKKDGTQKQRNENPSINPDADRSNTILQKHNNESNDNPKKEVTKKLTDPKNETVGTFKKTSSLHIDRFHAFCSKYWNNISSVLSCTDVLSNTKIDLPPTEEMKHKRKKKHKNFQTSSKTKINNENARQYRISAYIADQDWKKNKMENKDIDEDLVEKEIEVNHIIIPRLNLCFSSESTYDLDEEDKEIIDANNFTEKNNRNVKKRNFTVGALDRFFKKMSMTSIIFNNPSDKTESSHRKKVTYRKQSSYFDSDISMPRSIKYFKSLETDNSQGLGVIKKNSNISLKSPSPCSLPPMNNSSTIRDNNDAILKNISSNRSVIVSSRKWSTLIRFNKGLNIVKDLCTTIFAVSDSTPQTDDNFIVNNNKEAKGTNKEVAVDTTPATANAGINAHPKMKSCACQTCQVINIMTTVDVLDGQVEQRQTPSPKNDNYQSRDAHVMARCETCTCATQYYIARRDVGTYLPACTLNPCCKKRNEDSLTGSELESMENSDSDSHSSGDATKTDTTTVCSLATVDYRKENRMKSNRLKVNVVTKSNQSTLTERARVCDVSTVTQDWWSPIVEKKDPKNEIALEKKEGAIIMKKKERKARRNEGISTDAKIVTFRSRAQIIPRDSGLRDILSPYRYLLESQKHYNELFSSKFYSPHVFPVSNVLKYSNKDRPRSPVSSRHQSRRSRRTKRLDDSYNYTPRKHNIAAPRKKLLSKLT